MAVKIDGTTGFRFPDGTAAAPAETGTTSSTAGIFYPAANSVAISTSSSERLRVDSSGNVGIGTSSPGAKLDVSGAIRGSSSPVFTSGLNLWNTATNYSSLGFYNSSALTTREGVVEVQYGDHMTMGSDASIPVLFRTGGSERMRIDGSGNVGIGTSSPSEKLHVAFSDTSYSQGIYIQNNATGTGAWARVGLSSSAYYSHISMTNLAELQIFNAASGPIYFGTNNTERMRIDSSGNVGIGTSSPSNLLHVYRNNTGGGAQVQIEQAGSGDAVLGFLKTGVFAWLTGLYNSDNSYRIAASGANLATSTALTITSGGNVGIGTSSPNNALDVNGNIGVIGYSSFMLNESYYSGNIRYSSTGYSGRLSLDPSGNINFFTAPSGSAGAVASESIRMTILNGGNVGIGTSSPDRPLVISNNGSCSFGLTDTSTGGNTLAFNPAQNSSGFAQIDCSGANALRFNTNSAERMRIDSSGRVTKPYQPYVRCASNGSVQNLTGGTTYVIPYNIVVAQNGSNYNNSTYRFTCPVAGEYFVYAAVEGNSITTNYYNLFLRINGAAFGGTYVTGRNVSYEQISSTAIVHAAAGDYIDVALYVNQTGGYLDFTQGDNRNSLYIYQLG